MIIIIIIIYIGEPRPFVMIGKEEKKYLKKNFCHECWWDQKRGEGDIFKEPEKCERERELRGWLWI